ncbi:MAG TPA: crosslink repair DNA glycosylase YcaQ family protein [Longimicrobium sp.]|nr:crosslink repair DNA glycosylase YcaQ family protein [Longimicrobium sp.]
MDENRLRAWWWHRQGLDGSLRGASPARVLERSGWARSVGGVGPYLTLFARAGTSREAADAAVARLEIHELPSARGCTYVLPASDFALGLMVGQAFGGAEMKTAARLGVTEEEIEALCDAVLGALGDGTLAPDRLRDATGGAWRGLGEEGKKKGLTTTLPVALGRLQARGDIRRVPVNGRLDQQRYGYVRWEPNPLVGQGSAGDAYTELARRFFRWVGPATMKELQWFTGLGVKAAKDAAAPLDLAPMEEGSDRLLLPEDADAFRAFDPPSDPRYALVSSLDAISATRRDVRTLVDAGDADRMVLTESGERSLVGLADLPAHAILDRGRLIGLWEYDADAGSIAWATFDGRADAELERAVAETEVFVRDQLGDARSFSLDSPASRGPRIAAIRAMR